MTRLPVFLYRIYFSAKDFGRRARFQKLPWVGRGLRRLKTLIEPYALPQGDVWVQVQAGLSKGIWIQLRLPEETRHWRGEHETQVQDAICAVVHSGAVVYDIGAHVGTIALGTARLVAPQGRVVAFEGDPANVTALREANVKNHLESCLEVVDRVVWSHTANDRIPFRRGGVRRSEGGVEVNGQSSVVGTGEIIMMPAITLDDFLAAGGAVPQLIKIDVEGGEYEVLRGGANLFQNQRPLIIAEVHHEQASNQIHAWLEQYRYRAEWKIPRENFPRCLFAWPEEYDGATWMRNRVGARESRRP